MISLYYSKLKLLSHTTGDRYELYKALSTAFDAYDWSPWVNRVLWRLINRKTVLVQSEKAPNWGQMLEQPFLARCAETERMTFRLSAGQQYRFLLEGNPVLRRAGRAAPILDEKGQLGWLERQFSWRGLSVLEGRITGQEELELSNVGGENQVKVLSCRFEGVLEIAHAGRAQEGLRKGIGRSKFAGLGLLEIYRVR